MHNKQRGVTLVVALIMLVLLTLLVLTSANLGNGSLQTVGNMQQRNEAYAAAQETIEQAISNTRFFDSPNSVFPDPCNGTSNTRCIDTNGDNTPDVTVTLSRPACIKAQPHVPTDSSMAADRREISCVRGTSQENFSTETPQVDTSCWDSVWELQAAASDAVTNAKVDVTQGVAVTVPEAAIANSCP